MILQYESKVTIGGQLLLESNDMKVIIGFKYCKGYIDVIDNKQQLQKVSYLNYRFSPFVG